MNTNEASLGQSTVQTYSTTEKTDLERAVFALECTARWLDNGSDPAQAAEQIRLAAAQIKGFIADCDVRQDDARQSAAIDKPVSAEYRCRKCGDAAEVKFSYASSNDCCRKVPCVRPGNGPCDMPARQSPSKSISDAMMDLVDRLGHEWKDVDPRAWSRMLIYAPSVEQDERGTLVAEFNDAYRAFIGAFDTPQMRRQICNEYADDARKRLRDFAENFTRAANPAANVAQDDLATAKDDSVRGEVAYQLQTRNRFLDMATTRAVVDSAFDAAIAKNALPGARETSANVAQGAIAVANDGEQAMQDAAAGLPLGYEIRICIERGAGWVELYEANGTSVEFDEDTDSGMTGRIRNALDAALTAASGGKA
jgi:hypothetical protein